MVSLRPHLGDRGPLAVGFNGVSEARVVDLVEHVDHLEVGTALVEDREHLRSNRVQGSRSSHPRLPLKIMEHLPRHRAAVLRS